VVRCPILALLINFKIFLSTDASAIEMNNKLSLFFVKNVSK